LDALVTPGFGADKVQISLTKREIAMIISAMEMAIDG
jgi:hypothetical protein